MVCEKLVGFSEHKYGDVGDWVRQGEAVQHQKDVLAI